MEYRVEELARAAGVPVDTLRFYQSRGLLPPPRREGRVAKYGDDHLQRLRRIRELQSDGFKLAQIQRLLSDSSKDSPLLLAALAKESVGQRTVSRAELAAEAGVPEALVQAAQAAGLIDPLLIDGEERFGDAELEMAKCGLALLEAGFPLQSLLDHAVAHARNVQALCDSAIELFDDHVRKQEGQPIGDADVTAAFQRLLPHVTRLVALHFQRTLVNRALNRLRSKQDFEALHAALDATKNARLDLSVTWT